MVFFVVRGWRGPRAGEVGVGGVRGRGPGFR